MPTLQQKISIWENQLLDLSRRNRLINCTDSRRSFLTITQPDALTLYQQLVHDESKLAFTRHVTRDVDARVYGLMELMRSSGAPLTVTLGDIQSTQPVDEQARTLRVLRNKARLALDEQGSNLLYLAVGFVRWYDHHAQGSIMNSPLLLVPVTLQNNAPSEPYYLQVLDDEIVINPTLAYLFADRYHFEFPPFDADDDQLADYFDTLRPLFAKQGWSLVEECRLGVFSFQKINMYKDLIANENRVLENPVLRAMYAPGTRQAEEALTDHDAIPASQVCHIISADSSQLDAVERSRKGESFVLQGPPGTGKSQTITNIIAQALADGKRILFVSEKMAALQVVYSRLVKAGLGDFCLPLHDHKANKREILQMIGDSLEKRVVRSVPGAAEEEQRLDLLRARLNRYPRQLHQRREPLGLTLYEAFGRLLALQEAPTVLIPFADPGRMTNAALLEAEERLQQLADLEQSLTLPISENPWNGFRADRFTQEQRLRTLQLLEEAKRQSDALMAAVRRSTEELHWPVEAELSAVARNIDLARAILALPEIPDSWLDRTPEQLQAQLTAYADLARQHDEAEREVSAHLVSLPACESVLHAYADLPGYCDQLLAAGLDPSALEASDARLAALQQHLSEWLSVWCAALPEMWTEQQPIPEAQSLWQAIRILHDLPGYSLAWLNRSQRADTLKAARTLFHHASAIRAASSALTGCWQSPVLELLPVHLADGAAAMQHQQAGDTYPPAIAQLLSLRLHPEYPADVFRSEPPINIGAWLRAAEELLLGEDAVISSVALLDDAQTHLAAIRLMLDKLREAVSKLPASLKLRTLEDFADLQPAFAAIVKAGSFPVRWLAARHRKEARRALQELAALQADLAKQEAAILAGWDAAVLKIDAEAMLSRFRTDYATLFKFLRPGYHADVRQITVCRRSVGRPDDAEIIRFLTELTALHKTRRKYDALVEAHKVLFTDDEADALSDWSVYTECLDALDDESAADVLEHLSMASPALSLSTLRAVIRLMEEAKQEELSFLLAHWVPGLSDDFESTAALADLSNALDMHTARLGRLAGLFAMLEPYLLPSASYEDVLAAMRRMAEGHEALIRECQQHLTELAEANRAFDAAARHSSHLLQPLWSGRDTDWPLLNGALAALDDPRLSPVFDRLSRLIAARPQEDWTERFLRMSVYSPEELCTALSPMAPDLNRISALDAAIRISQVRQTIADTLALLHKAEPLFIRKEDSGSMLRVLTSLYRWAEAEQAFARTGDAQRQLAADHYRGWQTDWNTLLEHARALNRFRADHADAPVSESPWRQFIAGDSRAALAEWARAADAALHAWQEASAAFFACFDDAEWRGLPFAAQHARLSVAAADHGLLEQHQQVESCMRLIERAGLLEAVTLLRAANAAPGQYTAAWRKAFLLAWISSQLMDAPDVEAFDASAHSADILRFQRQDDHIFEVSKVQLQHELTSRMPHATGFNSGELAILTHELNKKARIMPIRKLFKQIPYLLQALKPCLMMSPLSVSCFLDSDYYQFDMVIFDEASQIFPQDAIGAILRGKQAIIAGDVKQMPPSNFFAVTAEEAEAEDDEELEEDSTPLGDSILEEANFTLPQTSLLWHYRSRDESLIAFSNQHFYKNNLFTFPGNNIGLPDMGVEYVLVADGVYQQRRNRREAERCVMLIFQHIIRHPERSLGVVAFSEAQQAEIEDLLWQQRERLPQYNFFFDEDRDEPFFIKNLENVQGDERDTIIFSICYARAADGRMRLNFGPLGRSGGERRLNVAVTRARYNVKLIGSILPGDIDLNRAKSEGARLLRSYIEYAVATRSPDRAASNPDADADRFADEVARLLEQQGYAVSRNVGRSAYRVDIAVHGKDDSGAYLAGILCDGPGYASARTARDRDGIRRRMLANLGWSIIDCWSADWAAHPESAKRALLDRLEAIAHGEAASPAAVPAAVPVEFEAVPVQTAESAEATPLFLPDYRAALASEYTRAIHRRRDSARCTYEQGAMLHIIGAEQPIHMDVLYQRMAPHCGREKVTSIVRDTVQEHMAPLLGRDIIVEDDFCMLRSDRAVTARKAGSREIDQISIPELTEAMKLLLQSAYGLERSEVILETARLLGYSRTGPRIVARLEEVLSAMAAADLVTIVHDKVQWKG